MPSITKNSKRLPWEWKPTKKTWSNDFAFYVTPEWRRMSKQVREEEPFCQECLKKGITKLTEVADHIVSIKNGGSRLDRNNLQGLCRPCNNAKRK
jgi:5-methylcytosine-specific restriction endonuclease McrA